MKEEAESDLMVFFNTTFAVFKHHVYVGGIFWYFIWHIISRNSRPAKSVLLKF